MQRIVIIGNGVAGVTAARHLRKRSDHQITVVSGESDHFFSRTALMYVYMGHMTHEGIKPYDDGFWPRNRIGLLRAWVRRVDPSTRKIHLDNGQELPWDTLIIASGSRSNRFDWPGQDTFGVQGLYHLHDLHSMQESTRRIEGAVVVGGGLIGVEMAEMLRSRDIPVTFLVRENSWMDFAFPPEESQMINRHILEHHIDLRLSTELDRILADDRGHVRAVVTRAGEEVPCQFVGLTVGVSPNVGFLEGSGLEIDRGVLVDEHLRSNLDGIYAIGDCAQLRRPAPGRRPVEALWYTGRAMGETAARVICGESITYDPGIWFNSAKFFDIEYQVYGTIQPRPSDDVGELFWEHPAGRMSIRIAYRRSDRAVIGFNLMGIRYRHEVCEDWIQQERSLPWVLENLGVANFDPELTPQYEGALIEAYNRQNPGDPVRLVRRRGLRGWLQLRRQEG